ncbi:YqjF family protein [Oceanobacillus sp. Castelsardo]|uniref:YqjF family protein n=1 Tax=Oceanobacillus sp. Castelsardo TaxID=1851204 RepID=UPI000839032C|nr:DUF2071 domain-containing protein [Oceanobacillus sp. Castelsardo]
MMYVKDTKRRKWAMLQKWENLLFVHWSVSAELLKKHLPPGLELDLWEDSAWISIVTFKVNKTRIRYLPRIPYIPSMLQVNVRTYVTKNGEKGVYFFTVDTNKLSAATGARLFTLPYFKASMKMTKRFGFFTMISSRNKSNAKWKVRYKSQGNPSYPDPSSIDHWLLERYVAWSYKYGKLYRGDIKHSCWKVQQAKMEIKENSLLAFLSKQLKKKQPIIHFAESKVAVNWIPKKEE